MAGGNPVPRASLGDHTPQKRNIIMNYVSSGKELPQEGTDRSAAGESLRASARCPAYSGGGTNCQEGLGGGSAGREITRTSSDVPTVAKSQKNSTLSMCSRSRSSASKPELMENEVHANGGQSLRRQRSASWPPSASKFNPSEFWIERMLRISRSISVESCPEPSEHNDSYAKMASTAFVVEQVLEHSPDLEDIYAKGLEVSVTAIRGLRSVLLTKDVEDRKKPCQTGKQQLQTEKQLEIERQLLEIQKQLQAEEQLQTEKQQSQTEKQLQAENEELQKKNRQLQQEKEWLLAEIAAARKKVQQINSLFVEPAVCPTETATLPPLPLQQLNVNGLSRAFIHEFDIRLTELEKKMDARDKLLMPTDATVSKPVATAVAPDIAPGQSQVFATTSTQAYPTPSPSARVNRPDLAPGQSQLAATTSTKAYPTPSLSARVNRPDLAPGQSQVAATTSTQAYPTPSPSARVNPGRHRTSKAAARRKPRSLTITLTGDDIPETLKMATAAAGEFAAGNEDFLMEASIVAAWCFPKPAQVKLFRCLRPPKKQPHWWTPEIAKLRTECIKAKRQYTRHRRRQPNNETSEVGAQLHATYREKQKAMQLAIKKSKAETVEVPVTS